MKNLTERDEWRALSKHQEELSASHMRDWFSVDEDRFSRFSLASCDLLLDYSRNRINEKTLSLLTNLARSAGLTEKIEALFQGAPINTTEKRAALHTALRDINHTALFVADENIAAFVKEAQEKLHQFVNQIHSQTWKGIQGQSITHVVNIGIGGSYTGPMMGTEALKDFAISPLQFHFMASVDSDHVHDILQRIDPGKTLFIISSKSFATIETLTNAHHVCAWMKEQFGEAVMKHHFVAVTAATQKAIEFGIPAENIFPLWEWVGGRYSIWSAIGLPLRLMIGNQQFADFLAGAFAMDQHFRHAPLEQNMPVILALLGIWYTNFFQAHAHAIVPYSHRLRYLVPYLQQADMESNGKRCSIAGERINYKTGPVLFGEEGVIGQHTYHQLLHQGQHLIPVDFILVKKSKPKPRVALHHDILMASALSQAQALMFGKTYEEARKELLAAKANIMHADIIAHHKMIPGNKPSNLLILEQISPRQLGALIALYEHKIFVQGVIWGINSFDQWGVELGKQLLPDILKAFSHETTQPVVSHPTTMALAGLLHHVRKKSEC